jgi:hypothetical protein
MTIAASPEQSAIGALLLSRLLLATDKGETPAKIQRDIEPVVQHRCSRADLNAEIQRVLSLLEARGLVTTLRGKTKKSVPKVFLTAEGRREALTFLRIDALKPKTTWSTLKKIYLPAQALGLSASTDVSVKAIASDPGFKAIMLKRQFQLPAAELPKLDDVLDALAWKLIGFEPAGRKFTLKAVKSALFNRALGDGTTADFKKAASQLLARRLGARRDDSKELRDAVMRGWVDHQLQAQSSSGETLEVRAAPATAQDAELDLVEFAAHVKAAASACTTGRYGSNKVFIAHVWAAIRSSPLYHNMSLSEFKERLAQANNARLLDLSRADLVQAMNADDVRQSEVQYLSATFHFVRI